MGEPTRRDNLGCLFAFAVVGAVLLLVAWFLGQLLLAPIHCADWRCAGMRTALNLSVISAFVGIGCAVLTPFTTRPRLLSIAATGAFAVAIFAGFATTGWIILPIINVGMILGFRLLLVRGPDR